MNNDKDEVQDLIEQLKNLQLQQTELLARLERARINEARRTGIQDKEESSTREFAIGDKVRIKNPTRFQVNQGVITKIGSSRITVHTKTGSKILRAPKNLVLER
jgi:dsDNA-specific endonuclease/ATPase MutS2